MFLKKEFLIEYQVTDKASVRVLRAKTRTLRSKESLKVIDHRCIPAGSLFLLYFLSWTSSESLMRESGNIHLMIFDLATFKTW